MLTILQGDAIEQLRMLPDESVHCCVTSPPYWGLRDYGTAQWEGGDSDCEHKGSERYYTEKTAAVCSADAFSEAGQANADRLKQGRWREVGDCKCGAKRIDSQLGLEKTPEEYVAKMVEVFRGVRRVLRKDGTIWLNLGDSYSSGGRESYDPSKVSATSGLTNNSSGIQRNTPPWAKPKDLLGIPWRVAFALQADGWWLRSDIIWAKPNPMPESVTDRPTKSHEYMFLLTKSANYFYDAEAIKEKTEYIQGARPFGGAGNGKRNLDRHDYLYQGDSGNRNKRTVWTVATAPYPEAHFATYPPDLIKPCILAGTSAKGCCAKCGSPWERITERGLTAHDGETDSAYERNSTANRLALLRQAARERGEEYRNESKTLGWQPTCQCGLAVNIDPCTVLDPFAGSGTTGAVALELGRKAILIELNPKYVELVKRRCNVTPGFVLA